ncbi:MAG: biotin--[acetyl-CoA-carboxylase] ligase [Armatimonadota bacterium]|nr:biotin--[acetyl-CoA-carboxylase] ligase [Armatimonadota bacterium]
MIKPAFVDFDTVSSTNDIALELAKTGAPEGTVVIARSQHAGRGRHGRVWVDEPGSSVLMSAILRPHLPPERFHELSFVSSIAAAESLKEQFGLRCELKWPNDVLVNKRKICGILIETTEAAAEAAVVIGIGVNVNQTAFPSEIAAEATSVALETGSTQDVRAATEKMAMALFEWYQAYCSVGFAAILERWRTHMCGMGTRAEVDVGGEQIRGRIVGIDDCGRLLLQDDCGATRAIAWAECISFQSL